MVMEYGYDVLFWGVSGLEMGLHFNADGQGMWLQVAGQLNAMCLFGVLKHCGLRM